MGDGASLEVASRGKEGCLSGLSSVKGAVPRKADARVRTRNGHKESELAKEGRGKGGRGERETDGMRERIRGGEG